MSRRTPCLLIAAGFVASCSDAPSSATGWPGEVDTLNSGVTVIRNPEPDDWAPPAPWTLEEDLRIGSFGSSGPEEFADIQDVAVEGRGFLYVSHRLPAEIRVFDTGSHTWPATGTCPGCTATAIGGGRTGSSIRT